MSPRARVVVTNDRDEVALLERRVLGFRYWEVAGGHVEVGESPAEAAVREVAEELGPELDIAVDSLTVVGKVGPHHLYAARVAGRPELRMRGPEVDRGRAGNRYRPVWVPRRQVARLRFLRPGVRAAVVRVVSDRPGGRP